MANLFARLSVPLDTPTMEARVVSDLPEAEGWQYEPKWDGFRCLAFRDGAAVALQSRSGKPLGRYFPEIVYVLAGLGADRFVIDGELILPVDGALSFDALQARLHPAASRVERLARETPAKLMLFDCLQLGGEVLIDRPLTERRAALEAFVAANPHQDLLLSPATADRTEAERWLAGSGGALDGVIAKVLDAPYQPGERAMAKRKCERTADCVVGGFRYAKGSDQVASLLLGLYDEAGLLHHVGFTAAFSAKDRAATTSMVELLKGPSAFDGSAPGGPSRWNRGKDTAWEPLRPELVIEVGYDQVTARRFRHGTSLKRWRPDKAPRQCTFDQLSAELAPAELEQLLRAKR